MVVGGDHRDTAFQFGASVSVDLIGDRIIDFEVSVCELICCKDTGKLIERTILPRLTKCLDIVATWHLHMELNDDGLLVCKFKQNCSINSHMLTFTLLATWLSKQWPWAWGKSQWQHGGACNARQPGANSRTRTVRCGRWMSRCGVG